MKIKKLSFLLLLCLPLFLAAKCDGDTSNKKQKRRPGRQVKIVSPTNETEYTIGDVLNIKIEVSDSSKVNDLALYIEDTLYKSLKNQSQTVAVKTQNSKVGWVDFYISYSDEKGKPHRDSRQVIFFSDTYPEQKMVKIENKYPHLTNSYTQGLEFYKGVLYESTGRNGESVISKVDLKTGNRLQQQLLDASYFGEGMTILNDTIYQLSWKAGKCFVYDLNFNPIKEFQYDGEGWGLTNNGQSIIMSNGTSEIVWRNPQTFEIEKHIYAFKPDSDVPNLNEIELINGRLFANVYTQNYIVEMDTTTGQVISQIDCSTLRNEFDSYTADVLNGIAFDSLTQKMYLTGKLWPFVFEVTFE